MGRGSGIAVNCAVVCRHGSDLELLWLWRRLVAEAAIQPLAWELPYATDVALKRKKKKLSIFWLKFLLPQCSRFQHLDFEESNLINGLYHSVFFYFFLSWHFFFLFSFFFLAVACISSQARDQTHTSAVT